ncbi:hypothetical protein SteCoe_29891 [Stentor coeruleus]|uniref:Uncharacterized protein n=1 Tax=Stentor coeruleus TaxID=5963 RepID=A0A1R2B4W8_9CILI|nr:hypothetical protein SteCoe_29891 [Stentor coeruleus]
MNNCFCYKRPTPNTFKAVPLQASLKIDIKPIRVLKKCKVSELREITLGNSFHRRSFSTTSQKTTLEASSSPTPPPTLTIKSKFIDILNAANCYFEEEQKNPITFPPCELDLLNKNLSVTLKKNTELNKTIEDLQKEYNEMCSYIEEQKQKKKTFDVSIQTLKSINERLDNDIAQAMSTFKSIKDSSLHSIWNEARTQKLSPMPIKYKPISNRMHRSYSVNN